MQQVLCPVMVGHAAELDALEDALDAAKFGKGSLILISGEAGIGKSRLAREVLDRGRARDMVVTAGRATEATTRIPFRPIGEALQSAVRELGPPQDADLAAYHAVLAPFVPEWARGETPVSEPGLVLLEGILRLSRAIAGERGLVLVLEDLHWADLDSLGAIEYLADHVGSERILCVGTERSGASGAVSNALATLIARRAAEALHLDPLTEDEVEAMAGFSLDVESVPPSVLAALRRRAEGVPFIIEEMLSAYVAAGGAPRASAEWWSALRVAEALPPSLSDLVRARLDSLDEGTRGVVRAAAILGRTFEWPLLPSMTGVEDASVVRALRAAVDGQVLVGAGGSDPDAFSFRHALMREAVLGEMLPPERAVLSLAAANAMEKSHPGLPGEWCERAAELREQAGDRLGAVRLLQESARRALARGAIGSAETTLRRARELAGDDYTAWVATDELLIEVLARAGKVEESLALGERFVAAFAEGRAPHAPSWVPWLRFGQGRRAHMYLKAANASLLAGQRDIARDYLEHARSAAPDDEEVRARVRSMEAALAHENGDLGRALSEATGALGDAEALGLQEVICEALDTIGRTALSRGDLEKASHTYERLAEWASAKGMAVWRVRALEELGAAQSLTHGDAGLLEEARALATNSGLVSALASIELELAWHELALARFAEAGVLVERTLDACRRFGLPLLSDALILRAALFAFGERKKDMESAIEEALDAGNHRPEFEAAAFGEARAVFSLVQEDRPAAIAALDKAVAIAARWRRGRPWFHGLHRLLKAIDWNEMDSADEKLVDPPLLHGYASLAEAVVLGRSGKKEDATDAFARADVLMPQGWRRHHAFRLVAEAAVGDGWGDAASWARNAMTFFDDCGLHTIANACKRIMRSAGVAVPRTGRGSSLVPSSLRELGVTSREMDVLLLVAEGLSNAEIAQRLFLSPRTIETHVKSLMRKVATGTRAQLVAFAGRHRSSVADSSGC